MSEMSEKLMYYMYVYTGGRWDGTCLWARSISDKFQDCPDRLAVCVCVCVRVWAGGSYR